MKHILILVMLLLCASCIKTESWVSVEIGQTQNARNGEKLVVVPELPVLVDSVEYYWDSRHIETIREMPFFLERLIENESFEDHKLDYWVYFPNGYSKHSITIKMD